ncbi:MAG: hypothetical protein LBT09_15025 [Planctomycetaceae bacterium]|jgi:hypothetical protein|nr:hypothetical protein [Planctomycetaceae bacterium]
MANRGGFSWKRLLGVTKAKQKLLSSLRRDPLPPQIQCPSCQAVLRVGNNETFNVTRSSG